MIILIKFFLLMNHIKNIIGRIVKPSSSQTGWKNTIMQNWQEIMGPLSDKIFIEKIQKDYIVLGVVDSCWMQELHMLSDVIKKKINENLDKPYIQNIQFKYSSKKIATISKIKKITPSAYEFKPLTNLEAEALSHIKDPELSKALTRFLQKCHHS
ncbi:DUF721 domain-containing protein [Candidatus Dependentiae bacterium]|nr:DUF721 domain-containing protein [Candidatus Dependentiae bacterium]